MLDCDSLLFSQLDSDVSAFSLVQTPTNDEIPLFTLFL